jgi:hypothetical protein
MMTRISTILLGAVPVWILVSVLGVTRPVAQLETAEDIMRVKLEHAQELLKAVVLEDYPAIEEHAFRLDLLAEASAWNVIQTPEYAQHSTEFRRAAQALGEAGRDRELDEAATAYADMTLQCVQCHKYVRGVKRAASRQGEGAGK